MKILKSQTGASALNLILTIVIVLLLISNSLTIYFLLTQKAATGLSQQNRIKQNKVNQANLDEQIALKNKKATSSNKTNTTDSDNDGLTDQEEKEIYRTNPFNPDTDGDGYSDKQEIESGYNPLVAQSKSTEISQGTSTTSAEQQIGPGEILVDWLPEPRLITYSNFVEDKIKKYLGNEHYEEIKKDFLKDFHIYEIGKIKQGNFFGQTLYLITYVPRTLFHGYYYMFRAVNLNNNLIVFNSYSDPWDIKESKWLFDQESEDKIINLGKLNFISIPNSDIKLIPIKNQYMGRLIKDYKNLKIMFRLQDGRYLYKDNQTGCFVLRANDGTTFHYMFDLKFLGSERNDANPLNPHLLDITWTDGTKNKNEYIYLNFNASGCGGPLPCYNYADYLNLYYKRYLQGSYKGIKNVGKTSTGDNIYALQDLNLKKASYDEKPFLQFIYDTYYKNKTKEKPTFEKFISDYPIIYWQDPFGDFIEFQNAKYMPVVECS